MSLFSTAATIVPASRSRGGTKRGRSPTVTSTSYPMYVASYETLNEVRRSIGRSRGANESLPCFETLLKENKVERVEDVPADAAILFVATERGGYDEYDPQAVRFKTLMRVLERLESGEIKHVGMNVMHRIVYGSSARTVEKDEWRSVVRRAYVWFEAFCVPQSSASVEGESRRARAMRSIPHYIERSDMFVILAPGCLHHERRHPRTRRKATLSYRTFRSNGLCVLTWFVFFLSTSKERCPALLIRSAEGQPEFVSSFDVQVLAVGTSRFDCCDRDHLHTDGVTTLPCMKRLAVEVLEPLIEDKIATLYEENKVALARFYTCNKQWFLRGLPRTSDTNDDDHVLDAFDRRFKWRSGREDHVWFDKDGNTKLLYAAAANRPRVVRALLERLTMTEREAVKRLEIVNARIRKEGYVQVGAPGGVNALHLAAYMASPTIVADLLDAGADPTSADRVGNDAFHFAALGGRVDVVRHTCAFVRLRSPSPTIVLASHKRTFLFRSTSGFDAIPTGIWNDETRSWEGLPSGSPFVLGRTSTIRSSDCSTRVRSASPVSFTDNIVHTTTRYVRSIRCECGDPLLRGRVHTRRSVSNERRRSRRRAADLATLGDRGVDAHITAVWRSEPSLLHIASIDAQMGRDSIDDQNALSHGVETKRSRRTTCHRGWTNGAALCHSKRRRRSHVRRVHVSSSRRHTRTYPSRAQVEIVEVLLQRHAKLTIRDGLGRLPNAYCHAYPDIGAALKKHQRQKRWSTKRDVRTTTTTTTGNGRADATSLQRQRSATVSVALTRRVTTATPLLHPMFLISVRRFLEIYGEGATSASSSHRLACHQVHLANGDLTTSDDVPMGSHIIFVSHEWLAWEHPDPDGVQTSVLCRVLQRFVDGDIGRIDMNPLHSVVYKHDYSMSAGEIQEMMRTTYIWIDWISMPQPSAVPAHASQREADRIFADGRNAVKSIPAYVELSDFTMILVPNGSHRDRPHHRTCFRTWRNRGWCLVELASSFFCRDTASPPMIVRSAEGVPEWISPSVIQYLSVGLADFTCCQRNHEFPRTEKTTSADGTVVERVTVKKVDCDKHIVLIILRTLIRKKTTHLFDTLNRPTIARLFLCNEHWLLRGLPLSSSSEEADDESALRRFTKRLRWPSPSTRHNDENAEIVWYDGERIGLLFYASMANEHGVVRALLRRITAMRDESRRHELLNAGIKKDGYIMLGLPGSLRPIHVAMTFGSPTIVNALLDAGASPFVLDNVGDDAFHLAAIFGRVDCIDTWLARFPAWNLERGNTIFGGVPLGVAVNMGSHKYAVTKHLLDVGASVHALSKTGGTILSAACDNVDADPATLRLLIAHLTHEDRATARGGGVNERAHVRGRSLKWTLIYTLLKAMYSCGLARSGLFVDIAMECGVTPLQCVLIRDGDYEAVDLLLSEGGADPHRRNDLGYDAFDLCNLYGPYPQISERLELHKRPPLRK